MNNHKVGDILLFRSTVYGKQKISLGVISSIEKKSDNNRRKTYLLYVVDCFDGMDGLGYTAESIAEFKADLYEYLGA